jgi:very-short-patch-repair endonuclease
VQLVAIGFTDDEIDYRVNVRRLIRIHQGVYAVGHEALSDRARMIAGLLAAGPGAVLSHRAAAVLWKLIPSMPPFVDVTLTDRRPRHREGLRIHHSKHIETTTHEGLPVTTPLRTLKDFPDPRAWSEALYLGLVDDADAPASAEPTRSELERKLLPAIRSAALPRPLVNHRIGRYRADFFWPEHKLVVETDGWRGHGHRMAFEHDRARDAWLQAGGYDVLRFTWRQVLEETLLVTVRIAQLLARTPHHALGTPPAGG